MSRSGELSATRVWKRFRPDRRPKRVRTFLDTRRVRGGERPKKQWSWALRDIDFRVEPGESVGLIGTNGSGKSTLLKLLTRVMYPHSGQIEAHGRAGALIEVASGIHPLLSGRENIFLYGTLLGLPRRDVANRFDAIVDFADIGHAIDRQVKFYSSGMKMRLGFAVAAFLEPDILLVDEVLAVGDSSFQQRCLAR
ncbi:MAG: ABC transporter ATP-binding protein [Acidimicrobiia bacterium]|nr:ABC transporter ATP-binding protein [Acidimicrobiia bacterium]